MKTYFKYALCIIRNNRLLVLEESGQPFYLLPGGRPETGESWQETLSRELKEELNVTVDTSSLRYLGAFEDEAAGEPDARVHVELYQGEFSGELKPGAEVARLVWFATDDDWGKLAPVTRNKILPVLLQRRLLT